MHVQFGGRYRLQVFHGDTDILLQDTGWFDNLITNNGMDLLGATYHDMYCYLGSETAAPQVTDTSITSLLGSSTLFSDGTGVQVTTAPYYGWHSRSFTFGIGAIVGTIGQVAVGSSATNLFSKARLTNTSGTPTTLTLGGIDRLVLTYELRQYIDTSDHTYTIDVNGVSTSSLTRIAQLNTTHYDGNRIWAPTMDRGCRSEYLDRHMYYGGTSPFVGAITALPLGTEQFGNTYGWYAYTSGNYYCDLYFIVDTTSGEHSYTAAHFAPNNSSSRACGGSWQFSLEPAVAKTQYQNFRLEARMSWARYTI